jgi:MFS family permease
VWSNIPHLTRSGFEDSTLRVLKARLAGVVDAYQRLDTYLTRNARFFISAGFIRSVALFVGQVLFNLYLLDLGYSQVLVGQVVSVTAIGVGVGGIPAGMITGRLGSRRTMILNNLLACVAAVLQALLIAPAVLLVASFCIGFSNSVYSVASQPYLMSQTTPEKGGRVFSLDFGVRTGAGILGGLVAGWLPLILVALAGPLEPYLQNRLTLLIAAVAILGALGPLLLMTEEKPKFASPGWRTSAREILRRRNLSVLLRYAATIGILSFAFGLVFPFYNLYFEQVLAASVQQIGVVMSINQLTMTAGFLLVPLASERVGAVTAATWLRVPAILSLIVLGVVVHPALSIVALLLTNALFVMAIPITDSYALSLVSARSRPMFVGLRMTTWNAAWALSSWLSGPLVERVGRSEPFLVTAALLAVYVVLFYILFRGEKEAGISVEVDQSCTDGPAAWPS